jgi:hypothetical protein
MTEGREDVDERMAEAMYVLDGMSIRQVHEATKTPLRTVQRWSCKGAWVEKRKRRQEILREINNKKLLLQKELIQKALDTLDPKAANAAYKWIVEERRASGRGSGDGAKAMEIDRPALFLEHLQFVAETLKERDPEALKAIARNYDAIIARFKEQQEGRREETA